MDHVQVVTNSHLPVRPDLARLRSESQVEGEADDRSEVFSSHDEDEHAGRSAGKTWIPASRKSSRRSSTDFRSDFQAYLMSRADRLAPGSLNKIEEENAYHSDGIGIELQNIAVNDQELQAGSAKLLPAPPRSIKASVRRASRRLSLTPSDVQFSVAHLEVQNSNRTQELLGLRSRAKDAGPWVLPWIYQDASNQFGTTTTIWSPGEPRNGRNAWIHAFAAVLVVFNCWGFSNAFGLFQEYYASYLSDIAPGTIAWIGSTQVALVFLLGIPIGIAVDRGYFKIAFYSGAALMVIGLFSSSFCTSWLTLWLTQGLLAGLGSGSVFTAGLIALMSWFDESKMGLAMGLGAAGSCLGGITFVLVARELLPSHGFPFTMRILSAIVLATMIPPCLIFRMRRQFHRPRPRTTPRRAFFSFRSLLVFADAPYLSAAVGLLFAFQGLYFGFVYIVEYGVQVLRLDSTTATNLLIFMLVANLPGRFVPALISDKCLGPLNTLIPSTLLSSAIIWLWLASGDVQQGGLTVIACFYGFASAGIQSLYAPTTYSFCLEPRRTDVVTTPREAQAAIDKIGLKAGGLFSCIGVACLIGTPISGALLNYRMDRGLDHPFLYAQMFAAGSLLLGACLLVLSRVQKVGCQAKRA